MRRVLALAALLAFAPRAHCESPELAVPTGEYVVFEAAGGRFSISRPPTWHVHVDSIGSVTVSREPMASDETEINTGVTLVLVSNPDPENYRTERLMEAGATLHADVLALAERRGDRVSDVRAHTSPSHVGDFPCARFDAFMDTHRGDRLEVWTHFGFKDGELLILMASREREEVGSDALLERVVTSIAFRASDARETWTDQETGASFRYPTGWVISASSEDAATTLFRPTHPAGLDPDGELAYSRIPLLPTGEFPGPAHDRARRALLERHPGATVLKPAAWIATGGPEATHSILAMGPGETPARLRFVTIAVEPWLHVLTFRTTGDPSSDSPSSLDRTFDAILQSFRFQ